MNECKRLSDCPADRLAQCRGQAVQARCDALQGLLNKADQQISDLTHAAPVPPAGDVARFCIFNEDGKLSLRPTVDGYWCKHEDVTRLTAERDEAVKKGDVIHKQLSALQGLAAERLDVIVALRAKNNVLDALCEQRFNEIASLQSELTKALSLVRWFYTHANVHQVGTVMMDAARDFIAPQSAPATKVCSHIWVSADNRGAGAGEICQACSEHRPAAKLDDSMIGIVHTPPMEYDEP